MFVPENETISRQVRFMPQKDCGNHVFDAAKFLDAKCWVTYLFIIWKSLVRRLGSTDIIGNVPVCRKWYTKLPLTFSIRSRFRTTIYLYIGHKTCLVKDESACRISRFGRDPPRNPITPSENQQPFRSQVRLSRNNPKVFLALILSRPESVSTNP